MVAGGSPYGGCGGGGGGGCGETFATMVAGGGYCAPGSATRTDATPSSLVGSSGSWDVGSELQALGSRMLRGRADEAAAARRSAEEAERAASRRLEDLERRVTRCQEEEIGALQRFLSIWHTSLETRFERQAAQMEAVERRTGEEVVAKCREESDAFRAELRAELRAEVDELKAQAQLQLQDMVAARAGVRDEVHAQVESLLREMSDELRGGLREELRGSQERLREELAAVAERGAAAATERQSEAAERLGALGCELERRDAEVTEVTKSVADLRARLGVTEAKYEAGDLHLSERLEPDMETVKGHCRALESQVEEIRRTLESLHASHGQMASHLEGVDVKEQLLRLECQQEAQAEAAEAQRQLSEDLRRATGSASSSAVARAEEHAERLVSKSDGTVRLFAAQVQELQSRLCSSESASERITADLRETLTRQLRSEAERFAEFSQFSQRSSSESRDEFNERCGTHTSELRALMSECSRLTEELHTVRCAGLCHEWSIPRCVQRLRYLSLTTEPGLWLDSEPLSLGPVGPFTLRLFPRGLRAGDGQCAVALRLQLPASGGQPPTLVDLAVGDTGRRVSKGRDPDGGGLMWMATGLGDLGAQTGGSDAADLIVRVQFPALPPPRSSGSAAAGAVGAAAAPGEEQAQVPAGGSPRLSAKPQSPTSNGSAVLPGRLSVSAQMPLARGGGVRDSRGVPSEQQTSGSPYGAGGVHPGYRGSPIGSASSLNSFATFGGRPSAEAFATAPARYGGTPAVVAAGPSSPTQQQPSGSPLWSLMEARSPGSSGSAALAPSALGSGRILQPAALVTGHPSLAVRRVQLEQRARAAFELPGGGGGQCGGSPGGEEGGEVEVERMPLSPTNPFLVAVASVSVPTNPFDAERPAPALAPAGATNAT